MADKFLPHRTQLQILRNKGLSIPNGSKAMRILEREGYHSIINGYRDLFCHSKTPTFSFKRGSQFDEIHALYDFDRDLRNVFLKKILKIEQTLRSTIAYEFSKRNRNNNRAYLDFRNFDFNRKHKNVKKRGGRLEAKWLNKDVHSVISMLNNKMSNQYNSVIKHYITEHQSVPLWILLNTVTLGELENVYVFLTPDTRNSVAKKFNFSDDELHWFITQLKIYRNICAHEERFFCSKQSWGLIDIYHLYQKMMVLLPNSDANRFSGQVKSLIKKYSPKFSTISFDQISDLMGFPRNF